MTLSEWKRAAKYGSMAVLLCLLPLHALAQSAGGSGTITGQAFCSDTQKPARFAIVTIASTNQSQGQNQERRGGSPNGTTTGPDGSFTIKDVPAGTYDLQISQPGYIQPLRQLNGIDDSDADKRAPWLRMLTRVTVQAGQTTNSLATEFRGADLQGFVLYDDGTPASGIAISTLIANPGTGTVASKPTILNTYASSLTDDRGHFSISGLADGTYTVQATPRGGGIFPTYLGDTIDRSESQLIALKSGDSRLDLEMHINITNLHQVRGVLMAGNNHALPNVRVSLSLSAGGSASLQDTTAADGSFSFSNVPDGKFTVSAGGARDPDSQTMYKGANAQITVSGTNIPDVLLTPTQ